MALPLLTPTQGLGDPELEQATAPQITTLNEPTPSLASPGEPQAAAGVASGAPALGGGDNVATIASDLMAKDSPLMKRAASQGRSYANSRGLLNSSMAAQASQSAMLDHVIPMASQTADQGFRKGLQSAEHVFTGGQAEAERGLKSDLFDRDALLQREKMTLTESMAEAERQLRRDLADKEVSSNDKRGAESLLANAFRDYEEAQRSILGNTEMRAEERNQLLENSKNMLTQKINYTTALYSTDFDWPPNPFQDEFDANQVPDEPSIGGGTSIIRDVSGDPPRTGSER